MTIKSRIQALLGIINQGIYEKETETALGLLAAVAGESIILLGPPGVAKSMVARRLKLAFSSARSFEYLMSRFSTPDEIFGPVSISRLKTSDEYVRTTDGYLPTADVAFLDEIWKAGPAIQNTLLTAINERLFRNGNKEVHIPLKLLVAASNELPAQGEGLEALWDRFIIRLESSNIKLEANFDKMLLDEDSDNPLPEELNELQIKPEEYELWQRQLGKVGIGKPVLDCLHAIRRAIRSVRIENTDERRDVYVSDRRWKFIARLLRTSAFLQDRSEVQLADVLPMYHCLWQEPEEQEGLKGVVIGSIFAQMSAQLADIKRTLGADIRTHRAGKAAHRLADEEPLPAFASQLFSRDYDHEIEALSDQLMHLDCELKGNLFVSAADMASVREYLEPMNKEIAFTRQDIAKLYD